MSASPPDPFESFCALILTNRRSEHVHTYSTLRRNGYTGPIVLVVDDEDPSVEDYRARFGDDAVQVFDKRAIAARFDEGDNFEDRRSIFYARNASFDIAEALGYRYFIQLDDDYTGFGFRFRADGTYGTGVVHNLDGLLRAVLAFFIATPALSSVALAQGGDFIGGGANRTTAASICTLRKAMNSFVCDTRRRFEFLGRVNEDVNTYSASQRSGRALFLTLNAASITQLTTQANAGGLTEMYRDSGTYVKSFYSVLYAPSAVQIAMMGNINRRLHHHVRWDAVAPLILSERHRRASAP